MLTPFVGEIQWVAFNYAPKGWMTCDGQTLPVTQYQALYSLLGNAYGGDGQSTFALPNLNGRVAIGQGTAPSGTTYVRGQAAGESSHALTVQEMPTHAHAYQVTDHRATTGNPGPSGTAFAGGEQAYAAPGEANAAAGPTAIGSVGANQPHENMQPSLALLAIIAVNGLYPSRS